MQKKLLCLTISFLVCSYSFAQDKSVSDIFKKLAQMIEIVESDNKEVVRVEADIIQTDKTTYRVLQQGWTYGVLAVGSDRIQDLDIEVYKLISNDWVIISKDTDVSSAAAVTIKPTYTGQYKIVIKAVKFYSGYDVGHYGLIIYHE